MTRIAFLDADCRPYVVTAPEPVSRPTVKPDEKGVYGRVEYTALHVVRKATAEDIEQWRIGK